MQLLLDLERIANNMHQCDICGPSMFFTDLGKQTIRFENPFHIADEKCLDCLRTLINELREFHLKLTHGKETLLKICLDDEVNITLDSLLGREITHIALSI